MDSGLVYHNTIPLPYMERNAAFIAQRLTHVPVMDTLSERITHDKYAVYPLSYSSEPIDVHEDITHLKDWIIIGSDPLIIVAILSWYRDKMLSQKHLHDFLAVLENEGEVGNFKRMHDVFMTNDKRIYEVVIARIQELRDVEQWKGVWFEMLPDQQYNVSVLQWFEEVNIMYGNLNNGNLICWCMMRDTLHTLLPYCEELDERWIVQYLNQDYVFLPLRYKDMDIADLDLRLKYMLEKYVEEARCHNHYIDVKLHKREELTPLILAMQEWNRSLVRLMVVKKDSKIDNKLHNARVYNDYMVVDPGDNVLPEDIYRELGIIQ